MLTSSVRRASNICVRVNPCSAASTLSGSLSSMRRAVGDERAGAVPNHDEPLGGQRLKPGAHTRPADPDLLTSSRSVGSRCPGLYFPRTMSSRTWRTTSSFGRDQISPLSDVSRGRSVRGHTSSPASPIRHLIHRRDARLQIRQSDRIVRLRLIARLVLPLIGEILRSV